MPENFNYCKRLASCAILQLVFYPMHRKPAKEIVQPCKKGERIRTRMKNENDMPAIRVVTRT